MPDIDSTLGADSGPPQPSLSRGRLYAFAAIVVLSVVGAALYAGYSAWQLRLAGQSSANPMANAVPLNTLPDGADRSYVLFRNTSLGETYGRVGLTYLDDLSGRRYITPLQCDRLYYAAGRGICLEAQRGVATNYLAHIFDRKLEIKASHPLAGPPSRARMSPDGRLAALTVFTSGHSYSNTDFSTRTTVIDAVTGHVLVEDLEAFQVLREGQPIKAPDFNFWGITFAHDGHRFYATLGTAGGSFLVEGDLTLKTMKVITTNVECPSLSPDNRRVAFKRRIAGEGLGRFVWRLYVMDLATLEARALPGESNSVDDQVEWLNDREIVYALPGDAASGVTAMDTWALPVDGGGPRRMLVRSGFSPAVIR